MTKFYKTKDSDVAAKLRKSGLFEVGKEGEYFIFIEGKTPFVFSAEDKNKVLITNVVYV